MAKKYIADNFIKSGGTASQYLMSDGTIKSVGQLAKTRKDITTASYTLLSSDKDKLLYINATSSVTITVPSGLTTNQEYEFIQYTTNSVSFVTSGTTLRYVDYAIPTMYGQYSRVMLSYLDTETYGLFGDLLMI